MIRRDAWEVYGKALAVLLVVYAANRLVERLFERTVQDQVLSWAAAFGAVQTGLILFLSFTLLGFRIFARWKENLYEQIRPAIRDRVLALAFEGESWSSEIPRHGPARQVLEASIASTLSTVKAAGRERVARFATQHGFAAQWLDELSSNSKNQRKRAVSLLGLISPVAGSAALFAAIRDKEPAVRAEAYRALLIAGDVLSVEQVFRSVLDESLLVRALLADDLKRHAGYLLAHTVPRVLEEGTPAQVARCFEVLIAWKRAIPSLDIRPWLAAPPDASLAPLLLALLPYVLIDRSVEEYVAAALDSPQREIQRAAAEAAGRLKLAHLIPNLKSALAQDRGLALVAAAALAQMGEAGEQSLEKILVGQDRKAAAVAMEALEHTTVKR